MSTTGFEPGRAVEIISQHNDQPSKMGTGYRIGGRLILTVAHIFTSQDNQKCTIRSRVENNPENRQWTTNNAEVIWQDSTLDAALIALPDSDEYKQVDSILFGEFPPSLSGELMRFHMYGWPSWAMTLQNEKPPKAEGRHIWGVIAISDYSSEGFIVLEAHRTGDDWGGVSGAAVFCCGFCVGIQVQHQRPDRNASLSALPITKLLQMSDFTNLLDQYGVPTIIHEVEYLDENQYFDKNKLQPPDKVNLVGRDELIQKIKKEVIETNAYRMIAFMQTPGVGKSALSHYLLNDKEILAHFPDKMLWAALGKTPNVTQELIKWSQLLGIPSEEFAELTEDEKRSERIRSRIGNRKMLILLDDVWEWEIETEQKKNNLVNLLVGGPNCLTILTTRRSDVIHNLSGYEPRSYVVDRLDTRDGLVLLERLAPLAVKYDRDKSMELVEAVGCIPFAITLIGKRLASVEAKGQSKAIQIVMENLIQAEERLQLAIQRGRFQPTDAPLSLEASILMSEDNLDTKVQRIFHAASIFRAKPKQFSLRALTEVCCEFPEFSEYNADNIQDLEFIVYEALEQIDGEGLLDFISNLDDTINDDVEIEEMWSYEQISEKFVMPQVVVDYAYKRLSEDERRRLHERAAKYYQACLFNYEEGGRHGEVSAYSRMYAYENENWQQVKASWLHHLSFADDVHVNLAFIRLYFDAFNWWGEYLEFRPFCEEVLEEWRARYPAKKDRKWLNYTLTFNESYPSGYQKIGRGNWKKVEESLLALRKLGQIGGDLDTLEGNDELRHIRMITNFYLSESRHYQDVNDTLADDYLIETLNILETDNQKAQNESEDGSGESDDAWLIPWVHAQHSNLFLNRGEMDTALKFAKKSKEVALQSMPLESDEELLDLDFEIIAINCRIEADVCWHHGDYEKAFHYYTLAIFCAWGFHAAVDASIDFYTVEFYKEMTSRTQLRLEELCDKGECSRAEQTCLVIQEFWKSYWEVTDRPRETLNITQLLQDRNSDVIAYVCPPIPTGEDIKQGLESEYYKHIIKIFPNMFRTYFAPAD